MARTCDHCSAADNVHTARIDLFLNNPWWESDLCLRCRTHLAEMIRSVLDSFKPPPVASMPRYSMICDNQTCDWEVTNYDSVPLTGRCPQCGASLSLQGESRWPFYIDNKRFVATLRRPQGSALRNIAADVLGPDRRVFIELDGPEGTPQLVEDDTVVDLANTRRFYSE